MAIGDTRTTEAHVFLGVFGFGSDPHVISELLDLQPSRVTLKGELMPGEAGRRGTRWRHERWTYASPAGRAAPIEDQLRALLAVLESRREAIAEAARRYEVGLMCAAYFHEVNPGFHLDAELIAGLAALRIDLDFDLYCLNIPEDDAAA